MYALFIFIMGFKERYVSL